MVVQARIRLRQHACITEEFPPGTTMTQITGERGEDVYVIMGPGDEAVARGLHLWERHQNKPGDVIQRTPTSIVFRGRNKPGGYVETIRASGCSILWPAVYTHDTLDYTVVAADRSVLRNLVEILKRRSDVEVRSVATVRPSTLGARVSVADIATGFTQRQLDVLRVAIETGYYDTPRRTDTARLAARFDIAPSTLKEHLRKAESRALHTFAALLGIQPKLAEAATKGPGRPRRDTPSPFIEGTVDPDADAMMAADQ